MNDVIFLMSVSKANMEKLEEKDRQRQNRAGDLKDIYVCGAASLVQPVTG